VRIGGARVGLISEIEPLRRDDGSTYAQVTMKLDKELEPLPEGSRLRVRPRSALGLKYIELEPGPEGGATLPAGSVLGVKSVRQSVELDEVFNMFDAPARVGQRNSLDGYGGGLAGRGKDLNTAIEAFVPLVTDLEPVMRNLSSRDTRLGRFFRELGDAASEAAPVAEEQGALFVNLDISFTALASIARPFLQETISESPPSEEVAIREFPLQRPFIRNQTALFRELRPGVATLPRSAPILADAFEAGTDVLPRTIQMNEDLADVFEALAEFGDDPMVRAGIDQLTRLSSSLRPLVHFLTPAQTVCNYGTLWFRNAASLLSDGDTNGTWQRFMVVAAPTQRSSNVFGPNNEGLPSSGLADGPQVENHTHLTPYPNTAAPGQEKECQAGNERFARGQTVAGNVPGNQGTKTDGQDGPSVSSAGVAP
jgi:phospholipid/cholesterol/gamma-HCH transport system substrate-binding protein